MITIFLIRQRGLSGKANVVDGARKVKVRDRAGRAIPAPEANAEVQANLDVCHTWFSLSLSQMLHDIYFGVRKAQIKRESCSSELLTNPEYLCFH